MNYACSGPDIRPAARGGCETSRSTKESGRSGELPNLCRGRADPSSVHLLGLLGSNFILHKPVGLWLCATGNRDIDKLVLGGCLEGARRVLGGCLGCLVRPRWLRSCLDTSRGDKRPINVWHAMTCHDTPRHAPTHHDMGAAAALCLTAFRLCHLDVDA